MTEEPEEEQEQKDNRPDWYLSTEPVKATENDIIEYQNSWKKNDGSNEALAFWKMKNITNIIFETSPTPPEISKKHKKLPKCYHFQTVFESKNARVRKHFLKM